MIDKKKSWRRRDDSIKPHKIVISLLLISRIEFGKLICSICYDATTTTAAATYIII